MQKSYAQSSFGQIHLRTQKAREASNLPPIVCLHPIPYSGLSFTSLAPHLNKNRDVIAPDYPGFGGSDKLLQKPSINDFAIAVLEALESAGVSKPFDLIGFHTGCLVGPEMAVIAPESVRRLVLIDVPYFTNSQQLSMYDKVVVESPVTSELGSLEKAWNFSITKRVQDTPLSRSYELLLEQLRAGDSEPLGYHAAFTYSCEDQFPKVQQETLIIASQSGLLEATRSSVEKFPNSKLIECLNITSAVLETGIEEISKLTLNFI